MKVWTIKEPGGREQLVMEERPLPQPKEGELLIEVKAAGINRTDILTRQFGAGTDPHPVLGVEVSGVVVENHSDREDLAPGTRVAGLVNRGGYAEYAVMPADRAIVLPETLSFVQGAAIPEVFLTAYQTLYWLGGLQPGEKVLIHAGASGVGIAAIQLAKKLSSAVIFTTAGRPEKLALCKKLGADTVINYHEEDFAAKVQAETAETGVDLILDFIGASYWNKNYRAIALDGRWILIGTLGGVNVPEFNILALMQKRLTLKATTLTSRSDAYKAKLTQEFVPLVMPLIASDEIRLLIHSIVSFEKMPEAHRQMENNENSGKIILSLEN